MLPLYALTLGLSALLMFWVQPLYTRLALPLLGGAPAVWITAMLFFQAALLAGYLYAHLSVHWLGLKRQSLLHGVLLLLAFVALPVALPEGWASPPAGGMHAGWQIGLMAVGVGLPFFAVSATAPLLQRWFAHASHARSADPYFLYSASNIGSIAALIGYPLLFEPAMRLGEQGWAWTGGYALLVLLIGWSGLLLWRRFVAEPPGVEGEELELSPDISWRRRGVWILLAFAPSSLMLGVTLHLSTDVAAVPLLWVVPLALYLLSFVIVFARRPLLPHRWMVIFQVPVLVLLAATLSWSHNLPWVEMLIHLEAFFIAAMVCHGELAARRPAARHLTEFYLWMSVGGVLGGLFNALLAPVLFDSVLEYPLMVVLVALLRPWRAGRGRRDVALDLVLPGLLALLMWSSIALGEGGATAISMAMFAAAAGSALLFPWRGSPLRFALGLGVLMVMAPLALKQQGLAGLGESDEIHSERSFFGVNRVTVMERPFPAHVLIHGTTVHGAQRQDENARKTPQTYYHPDGPLGQVFQTFPFWRFNRVGVVGLGTGAAACYARPGQNWAFYEIDPVVEQIARDERFFTYLADCAPEADVVIGDARLSLQVAPEASFDLLILDAFSSDAIPVHLLTREAFAMYRHKLAPGGVIMVHISNRYLDLEPVLGRITAEIGLFGVIQYHDKGTNEIMLRYPSIWVVMARSPDDIIELAPDPRWQPLRGANAPLWTDDYVNILGALRRGGEGS